MRLPFGALTVLAAFALSIAVIWLAYGDAADMTVDGNPPLIKASAQPLKRAPEDPGGQAVVDSGGIGPLLSDQAGAAEERLLPQPEQPVTPSGVETSSASRAALDALVSEIRAGTDGVGGPNPNGDVAFPTPPRPQERVAVGSRNGDATRQVSIQQERVAPPPGSQSSETDLAAIDRSGAADNPLVRSSGADGRYRIQLAAVRGESDAQRAWTLFQGKLGSLVSGLRPFFERAETSNGIFYRVQVGPFGESDEADKLCSELKEQDVSCFVVTR
jgi:cell division septation protein DedD